MSTEAANAVMERLETDEDFAERLKAAGGPEASVGFLGEHGYEVTPDEMRDALIDRFGDQLTPEQLDALVGGADIGDVERMIAAFGIVVGVSAAVVAAV